MHIVIIILLLYENLLQFMDLFKHQCPICLHYFAGKGSLSGHIESIHEGKTYPCQYCEQKFTHNDGNCIFADGLGAFQSR